MSLSSATPQHAQTKITEMEGFVCQHMGSFLQFYDLCRLEAASKVIGKHLELEQKELWRSLASYIRPWINFGRVEKSMIKDMLQATQDFHVVSSIHGQTTLVQITSAKSAMLVRRRALHLSSSLHAYLQHGGQSFLLFAVRFCFSPEVVQAFYQKPDQPQSSIPITLSLKDRVFELTLILHKGVVRLSIELKNKGSVVFCPVHIELETISSPLLIRQRFFLHREREEISGAGICHVAGQLQQCGSAMMDGIDCMGLVTELSYNTNVCSQVLSALQCDKPHKSSLNSIPRLGFPQFLAF